MGESRGVHKRRFYSSWELFGAWFGIAFTLRRVGYIIFWLITGDIEPARFLNNYFYFDQDGCETNTKSGKVGPIPTEAAAKLETEASG